MAVTRVRKSSVSRHPLHTTESVTWWTPGSHSTSCSVRHLGQSLRAAPGLSTNGAEEQHHVRRSWRTQASTPARHDQSRSTAASNVHKYVMARELKQKDVDHVRTQVCAIRSPHGLCSHTQSAAQPGQHSLTARRYDAPSHLTIDGSSRRL